MGIVNGIEQNVEHWMQRTKQREQRIQLVQAVAHIGAIRNDEGRW